MKTVAKKFAQRPVANKQGGFSLVELLIAMAISLALIAVVVQGFASMSNASRGSTVQQQMNEDAQAAFQILGPQLRMAGFNPLQARSSTTITPERNTLGGTAVIDPTVTNGLLTVPAVNPFPAGEIGLGIFGCQTGFSNGLTSAGPPATVAAAEISQLTCNAVGGMPSIAVQFEADKYSPNISGNNDDPSDCRGFSVVARNQKLSDSALPSANLFEPYSLVENRYFISNGGLSCTGNGTGATGLSTPFETPIQPLVANIESMQIDYGVRAPQPFVTVPQATLDAIEVLRASDPSRSSWPQAQKDADDQNQANLAAARVTAGYLTANQIGAASGNDLTGVNSGFTSAAALAVTPELVNGSQRWNLVSTVRVCLVVRATTATLTDELGRDANNAVIQGYYFGCNPVNNTPINITDGIQRKAYTMHFAIRSRLKTPL